LDTNVLLRAFSDASLLVRIKKKAEELGLKIVLSEQILSEIREHIDVIARASLTAFKRALESSKYSIGIEEALKFTCSNVGAVLFELCSLERVDAYGLDPGECEDVLEKVAVRDPDDVHVALLALAFRPSIIVTEDREAFDRDVSGALEACGVRVLRLKEFLRASPDDLTSLKGA